MVATSSKKATKTPLMDSILVNYDALDWTVGFCRKVRIGLKSDDIEGWLLCRGYMQIIGLDVATILKDLSRYSDRDKWSENPPLDFWRRAISKVACRMPNGKLEFCRPGMQAPLEKHIDQVVFNPDPSMIPYCDITEAMKRAGRSEGMKLRDLLFQYHGKYIRSANALADMMLNRDLEPRHVCDALDRWRDGLVNRIETGTMVQEEPKEYSKSEDESVTDEEQEDVHVPDSFHGKMIFGAQLAKYVGRDRKTLRRWDKMEVVPSGKTWYPGMKVSGNLVVYDLADNWPAIHSMMRRNRDTRTDKQIAHELGVLSADACDWSKDTEIV